MGSIVRLIVFLSQHARNRIDKRSYQKHVSILIEHVVRESKVPEAIRATVLGQLDRPFPNSLLHELYDCTSRECFDDVLRRMGLSGDSLSVQVRSAIVEGLRSALFAHTAEPPLVVVRDDVLDIKQGQESLTLAVQEAGAAIKELSSQIAPLQERLVDPEVGNIAVLSNQVSFPLLVPWSSRLNNALDPYKSFELHNDPLQEYQELVEEVQKGSRPSAMDSQTTFEEVAILCVEGQFADALARLQNFGVRVRFLDLDEQILYHRLRGAVHWSLGRRSKARVAYELAKGLLEQSATEGGAITRPTRLWLERQVDFDLLSIDLQGPATWEEITERAELVRSIPAWHSNPAIDAAMVAAVECISQEWVGAKGATESTFRSSSLLAEAIAHYNRALALSYLTGDFLSAKSVRLKFAAALAPHLNPSSEGLLKLVASELLAANSPKEVDAFLSQHADSAFDLLAWDEVAVRHTGATDEPGGDEDAYRTTLAVIEHMAPYLSEGTLSELNDDFLERSRTFLENGIDAFIQGRNYREDKFIRAYSRVFRPNPEQLLQFVNTLAGHPLVEPFSFWEVLAGYQWRVEDTEAARRAVEGIYAVTSNPSGNLTYLALRLLQRLTQAIPDLRTHVADRLVKLASEGDEVARRSLLLTGRYDDAVPHAKPWTEEFVNEAVERLTKASTAGAFPIMRPLGDIAALPAAIDAYKEQFEQRDLARYTEQLWKAVASPNILAGTKASVYRAMHGLVRHLTGSALSAVREKLAMQSPLEVDVRTIDLPGPWGSQTSDEARLALLLLRCELGLNPSGDEMQFLLQVIKKSRNTPTLAAACDVVEALVPRDGLSGVGVLLGAVYDVAASHERLRQSARALRCLARTVGYSSEPLTSLALGTVSDVVDHGHQFLVQTLFHEAGASWTSLDGRVRLLATEGATACLRHPHRSVRRWATELLRIAEVPIEA